MGSYAYLSYSVGTLLPENGMGSCAYLSYSWIKPSYWIFFPHQTPSLPYINPTPLYPKTGVLPISPWPYYGLAARIHFQNPDFGILGNMDFSKGPKSLYLGKSRSMWGPL